MLVRRKAMLQFKISKPCIRKICHHLYSLLAKTLLCNSVKEKQTSSTWEQPAHTLIRWLRLCSPKQMLRQRPPYPHWAAPCECFREEQIRNWGSQAEKNTGRATVCTVQSHIQLSQPCRDNYVTPEMPQQLLAAWESHFRPIRVHPAVCEPRQHDTSGCTTHLAAWDNFPMERSSSISQSSDSLH